jgi:uncharacterized protein (DUF1501 family)
MNRDQFNYLEPFRTLSRREFLKLSGGCSALTSTSILSTLVSLKLTNSAVATAGDLSGYKAIVCIFLLGGYDSFNVLVPNDPAGYADYSAHRRNLALRQIDLLPVVDRSGRQFGIHPGMPEVRDLYNSGKLGFLANVGSLVAPTTKADYNAKRNLPVGLFSHSDLIQHWQTSIPQSRQQVNGWGGRMADILTDTVNSNPFISMNIALNAVNVFQTGNRVIPFVIGTGGATVLNGYNGTGVQDRIFTRAINDLQTSNYAGLLEKSYATTTRGSIDAAIAFNAAFNNVNLTTVFPNTSLGNQLKAVARTIGSQAALGQARQIFFVSWGGWDHHDEVLNNQANMLPQVSQAMKAFYDATVELGVSNNVTSFTASDFARTLSSNGNGSDHAWGGNHLVMGGAVSGGHVYGQYPTSLAANGSLDVGRGRLIPTTSVDAYNAELALWYGLDNDNNLEAILPNIRNFLAAGSSTPPVGFLLGGAPPPPSGGPSPGDRGRLSRSPVAGR